MIDQVLGTILFSLENIIEVTVLPVAPPNWNLGVGSTVFTVKWVSKNVLSSSSVQLQDVMKKKLGWQEGNSLKGNVILSDFVTRWSNLNFQIINEIIYRSFISAFTIDDFSFSTIFWLLAYFMLICGQKLAKVWIF